MKIFNGYFANEPDLEREEIMTAREGNFYNPYTTMKMSRLVEGVEGINGLMDANLKELLKYRHYLEQGHTVNVHLQWELTEDRSEYQYVNVLKVIVVEPIKEFK